MSIGRRGADSRGYMGNFPPPWFHFHFHFEKFGITSFRLNDLLDLLHVCFRNSGRSTFSRTVSTPCAKMCGVDPVQFLLTVFFANNQFFFCRARNRSICFLFKNEKFDDDSSSSSSETRRTNSTMLCIAADLAAVRWR